MIFTPAYAQDGAAAAGGGFGTSLIFMGAIFLIFYMLVIRPQQKKMKQHREAIEQLRRGDQVVTQGGILAKVTKVMEGDEIEVEIAKDVKVRVVKSTITAILSKTEPAKEA